MKRLLHECGVRHGIGRWIARAIPPILLAAVPLAAQTPADVADELLAADRAFSAEAGDDLVAALTAMFSENVILPAPGGTFLRGRDAALEALQANPANVDVRAHWDPLRAGVSADGLHGFTFGYMAVQRADSTPTLYKYMTYWERQPDGWRARAWKRAPFEGADVAEEPMEPALPPSLVPAETDPDAIRGHEESLAEAERAFSRDAQSIGLGPAFVRHGRPDAVNMGPRSSPFLVGAEAIGAMVGEGEPPNASSVSWGPDEAVIVASSGDLGITFGRIRSNDPAAADSPPFPFFTIWRRDSRDEPWRYVAE